MAQGFTKQVPIDIDSNLSLNSDMLVPSQKAIKSYVDNKFGSNSIQVDSSNAGTLTGLINSSNTVYTTSNNYLAGIKVYRNGQLQTLTIDYTETSTNQITFVTAPTTGDYLTVEYLISQSVTGNADTLDGLHAGSFVRKIKSGEVLVDFGASGDIQQTYTVIDGSISSSSLIVASIKCIDTTNNSADDIASQLIDLKVTNLGNGSCDILVSSIDGILNYEIPVSYLIYN